MTTTTTTTGPILSLDTAATHLNRDLLRPDLPTRYILGVDDEGTPAWWEPHTHGPLQVVGGVGAGGTTLLRSVAAQALRTHTGRVDVIDAKGGACWADLAAADLITLHPVGSTSAGVEAAVEAVRDAAADAEARTPRQGGRLQGPRRFLMVDELELLVRALQVLDTDVQTEIREALAGLYLQGDRVGVHLVARSHRPTSLLPRPEDRGWSDTLALARLPLHQVRRLSGRAPLPPAGGSDQRGRWLITGRKSWPVVSAPAAFRGSDTIAFATGPTD